MSNITHEYIEEYLRALIKDREGIIKEIEDYAIENHVPIVHKEVANFLETMMSIIKPSSILELGTAIGYSAIVMAQSSDSIKKIDTIERNNEMVKIATDNIKRCNLENTINIIEGDCLDILKTLDQKYDLIFMDAGKGHYNHFLPDCLRLLKEDGVIIADNVLYKGMVASDELVKRRKITIVRRMQTYLDIISTDETLKTTVIPMGDGIAITKRRDK